MIHLYNSDNLNYDFNGNVTLEPSSCILSAELNNMIEVELTHSHDREEKWKDLKNELIIKVPYPNKNPQLFRIYETEKDMTSITCRARHIFFDVLNEVLVDVRPTDKNGQQALDEILKGTKYKGYSDIGKSSTAYYIRKYIASDVLLGTDENSYINRWGGELDVDNHTIYMNERCGGDYGVEFRYSQNLLQLEETINMDEVVTRAIPVGYNGLTIPEIYVDSPLIDAYQTVRTKVITFDDIKVKETSEDEDGFETETEAQQALRDACDNLFNNNLDKPIFSVDVEVAKLENTLEYKEYKDLLTVGIGDTVKIIHEDIEVNIDARVTAFEFDCLTEKYETITVANFTSNYLDQQNDLIGKVDNITNSDGSINAEKVKGFLDAQQTKLSAQREIAQKQHVRAIIFEDLDESSPTYGCCAIGTAGLEVSDRRSSDGRSWIFDTAITGSGINANTIVAGSIFSKDGKAELNLDKGYLKFIHTDGSYTLVNSNGFNRYISNTNKSYHYLFYQITARGLNLTCGTYHAYTITLPSEFRGKSFLPTCAFKRCVFNQYPGSLTEFEAAISNIDYKNATFTLTVFAQGIVFNQVPGSGSIVNTSVSKNFSFEVVCTAVA